MGVRDFVGGEKRQPPTNKPKRLQCGPLDHPIGDATSYSSWHEANLEETNDHIFGHGDRHLRTGHGIIILCEAGLDVHLQHVVLKLFALGIPFRG